MSAIGCCRRQRQEAAHGRPPGGQQLAPGCSEDLVCLSRGRQCAGSRDRLCRCAAADVLAHPNAPHRPGALQRAAGVPSRAFASQTHANVSPGAPLRCVRKQARGPPRPAAPSASWRRAGRDRQAAAGRRGHGGAPRQPPPRRAGVPATACSFCRSVARACCFTRARAARAPPGGAHALPSSPGRPVRSEGGWRRGAACAVRRGQCGGFATLERESALQAAPARRPPAGRRSADRARARRHACALPTHRGDRVGRARAWAPERPHARRSGGGRGKSARSAV